VRIFEGIVGVFQDAHFPEGLRTFGPGAHLRRPISHFRFWILDCRFDCAAIALKRIAVAIYNLRLKGNSQSKIPNSKSPNRPAEKQKSRAFNLARLRIGEIYSLSLYRISIATSLIMCEEVESFKIKVF
jgi:hypothetical protein